MTITEARNYFGLKDTDTISIEGVKSLLKNTEDQLKVWSLTNQMRKDLEIEKEACIALLKEDK